MWHSVVLLFGLEFDVIFECFQKLLPQEFGIKDISKIIYKIPKCDSLPGLNYLSRLQIPPQKDFIFHNTFMKQNKIVSTDLRVLRYHRGLSFVELFLIIVVDKAICHIKPNKL